MVMSKTVELDSWLESLSVSAHTAVLAEMRGIRKESDAFYEEYRRLSPPSGYIPAGSEHFRAHLKAEGLATFLGHIGKGKDPIEASDATKEEMSAWVRKFNSSRKKDYQVQVWEDSEHDRINTAALKLVGAARLNK